MIKAIQLGSQPETTLLIKQFSSRLDSVYLYKTFSEPEDVIRHVNRFSVDLIFIDFQHPGLEIMKFISRLPARVMIMLMSETRQYILEGLISQPIYFLKKPLLFESFQKAMDLAEGHFQEHGAAHAVAHNYLYLRADYSLKKVDINEIAYIQGLDDYLKIHLSDKKVLVVKMTMKGILEKLQKNEFVRVHRSYIVPLRKIRNIRKKTIYLKDAEIPIGVSYEQEFMKMFDLD